MIWKSMYSRGVIKQIKLSFLITGPISHIRASLKQLRHVRSIKDTLTPDSMLSLVHTWIIEMLSCMFCINYCISKLQCIQNAAARLSMGTKQFKSITSALKSLYWLPVEKRIDFTALLLVYRALHDQAPEYMRNMLQERTNFWTLCSTVSSPLAVPRSRLKGLWEPCF